MLISLLDGAVAVVFPRVVGLATTLGPIGGAATAVVVRTAVPRHHLFHSGGRDSAPQWSGSCDHARINSDQATGAAR
jgi:hypothetical protein